MFIIHDVQNGIHLKKKHTKERHNKEYNSLSDSLSMFKISHTNMCSASASHSKQTQHPWSACLWSVFPSSEFCPPGKHTDCHRLKTRGGWNGWHQLIHSSEFFFFFFHSMCKCHIPMMSPHGNVSKLFGNGLRRIQLVLELPKLESD